jgi:hypothetical protein
MLMAPARFIPFRREHRSLVQIKNTPVVLILMGRPTNPILPRELPFRSQETLSLSVTAT